MLGQLELYEFEQHIWLEKILKGFYSEFPKKINSKVLSSFAIIKNICYTNNIYFFYCMKMSFETPERVDLSQDITSQEALASLTADEQARLQEYLDAEQQKIIYLTQQELGELKNILGEDASASHEADFDEFMQEQITE